MMNRRQALAATLSATAGVSLVATETDAQALAAPTASLPFDPKSIPGLSERLLVSHFDNNYLGAVRRLAAIRAELAGLDAPRAPGFHINGLKREELIAWNSAILHEIYFAGLGAKAAPAPGLATAIERDFGSHAKWAGEFSAMGKALGGGSGWVLLTWSRRDGHLVNTWAADHTMTLADGAPLLALDMYEHAYALDYGARAGGYVDAFMAAMTWTDANRRFLAASRI